MEDADGAHEHPPTPPVVDAAALHPEYDGPDRRQAAAGDPIVAAITHAVRQVPTATNQPDAMWHVVADAAVVALGLLTLVLMFKLSGDIRDDTRAQEKFRNGISCFLVDSVQRAPVDAADRQRAATEMLIRCGFIETPGNGR